MTPTEHALEAEVLSHKHFSAPAGEAIRHLANAIRGLDEWWARKEPVATLTPTPEVGTHYVYQGSNEEARELNELYTKLFAAEHALALLQPAVEEVARELAAMRSPAFLDEARRCERCGFSYSRSITEGCRPGDCSMRPAEPVRVGRTKDGGFVWPYVVPTRALSAPPAATPEATATGAESPIDFNALAARMSGPSTSKEEQQENLRRRCGRQARELRRKERFIVELRGRMTVDRRQLVEINQRAERYIENLQDRMLDFRAGRPRPEYETRAMEHVSALIGVREALGKHTLGHSRLKDAVRALTEQLTASESREREAIERAEKAEAQWRARRDHGGCAEDLAAMQMRAIDAEKDRDAWKARATSAEERGREAWQPVTPDQPRPGDDVLMETVQGSVYRATRLFRGSFEAMCGSLTIPRAEAKWWQPYIPPADGEGGK